MKTIIYKFFIVSILIFFFSSCERELERFELLNFERCELDNVTVDQFIITDFECQSNIELSNVDVIRNPTETGDNTSRFVGRYIDDSSPNNALTINLINGLDLTNNATFSININTLITGTLEIQLLGGSNGLSTYEIIIDGNGRWVRYEVDFIDDRDNNFNQINLIFNSGLENNPDDIYLLDNIRFNPTIDPCEGVETDLRILNDFECQQNVFLGSDPEQTSVNVIDNPAITGINQSMSVGEYFDNGTEPFDNLEINFDDPIDLSENSLFSLKVFSTIRGPLLVKLEGGSEEIERVAAITSTNQWVEYTFDFSDAIGDGNDTMVIFFNSGSTTSSISDRYLIDDLSFEVFIDPCAGITPDQSIISDFECQQNFMLGNNPTSISIIDNFEPNEVNMSESIGRYIDDGTQPFDNLSIDFGMPIDLSMNSLFSLKVYSSEAVALLARLDGGNSPIEVEAQITETNEWVEYTFDFSSVEGEENERLILFFNAGQSNGTTTDEYFIDELRFNPNLCSQIVEDCTGVAPNLTVISDFDCQQNFHLGAVSTINDAPVVQNPNVECENRSSNVGRYIDNGTEPFDNLFIDLGAPFNLSNNSTLRLLVLSSRQIPVLAKLEGGSGDVEIRANVTEIGQWTELSFDFSGAIGNNNDSLVLFFNAGETNGTTTDTYFIDNIRFE